MLIRHDGEIDTIGQIAFGAGPTRTALDVFAPDVERMVTVFRWA